MNDKKRVLVIDDEPLIRQTMSDYLEECGYEAATASDGLQGLDILRRRRFDVVLVDLRMPRMDGLEVITTLREEQPNLPTVVISGTGVLNDAIEAMRRGAWDYITKPVLDLDEVTLVIEQVLEKAALISERDRYRRELEQVNRSLEAEVARQTESLRIQNRELRAMNRVSYVISSSLDLDTILHRALEAAITAIEADGGAVRLLNPDTGQLVIAAAHHLPDEYLRHAQAIPLGAGIIGRVARDGHPLSGSDFDADPWLKMLSSSGHPTTYLCVPLRAEDRILGTLGVTLPAADLPSARTVELLAAIGNQLGVAIARIQYSADLEKANARLEQALAEMKRLDMLREQFIQNVAHELRTPLGLVYGYTEMLAQEGLSPEEQRMAVEVISKRMRSLVDLVDSITTLQDLNSQPLKMEPVNIPDLIETVRKMTEQRAAAAGITLQTACPPDVPPVNGDFTRLTQALHQVTDNACKFSPAGSTVSVEVQKIDHQVLISIADQGIGIPAEEHERIFDRFYQVDGSATRRYGGTGLGLAIAKEIVEAHAGHITVESAVGAGSTFTIHLPLP